jgi:uncharacterized membrane protein YeaQ/YmgE (transglycosylase-associated protein family)
VKAGVDDLSADMFRQFRVRTCSELGGFILTTALGIAGAFVATFIGQTIGWYRLDQGAGLIGATVGSFLVLFIWNRFFATRAPAAGNIREPGSPPRRWL